MSQTINSFMILALSQCIIAGQSRHQSSLTRKVITCESRLEISISTWSPSIMNRKANTDHP
jgi:hypothetical protein